jgi:hypothetical protein
MKKHIQLLAFIGLCFSMPSLQAQTNKIKQTGSKKSKKEVKTIYDFIDSTGVPEKYLQESVVILGHYEEAKIIMPGAAFKVPGGEEKVSKAVVLNTFTITRYLLQDKNALEKFSTYYFTESEYSKLSISIISKNGKRKDLDMSDAISVQDEANVKSEWFSYSFTFGNHKKMALPSLEVGDMVEFSSQQYTAIIDPADVRKKVSSETSWGEDALLTYNDIGYYSNGFSTGGDLGAAIYVVVLTYFYPQLFATKIPSYKRVEGIKVPEFEVELQKVYPVLKQRYEFTTHAGKLPFEYTLLNGAAKPKITTSVDDQKMVVESEMNDAVTPEYFMVKENNIPMVRFTYNYKKYEKFNMHFNAQGKGLSANSASLLAKKLVNTRWKANGITAFFNIEKEIGKELRSLDKEEKLKYYYYYYKRNYSLETYIASRGSKISSQTSLEVTKLFQLVCDRYDIPYEIIMYMPRNNGTSQSAVSGDNMLYGILAKVDGKDIYLTDFDAYSEYNVPSRYMYGAEVFYVNPADNFSSRSAVFQDFNANNTVHVKSAVKLNPAASELQLNTEYTISGELKTEYYRLVNNNADYVNAWERMMGESNDKKDEQELNFMRIQYYSDDFREVEKQEDEKERLRKSFNKLSEDAKKEVYGDFIESKYLTEAEIQKVEKTNTGITVLKSANPEEIKFSVQHTLKSTVTQVGDGALAVDFGRLIQSQTELAELDDRTRKYQIDVNYHKTFTSEISLELPAGYNPINLEDFNASIDNDLIAFYSEAKIEGQKIVLTCTKSYKKVQASADEWNKMVLALDAAAHVFQKKLILEN